MLVKVFMKVPTIIISRSRSSVVAERERRLWQDLFANAGEWWDNRVAKTSARHPDFRHKTIKVPLWLSSELKPSWVDAHLPALNASTHASPSFLQLHRVGDLDTMLYILLCIQDHSASHGMYWSLARAYSEKRSLSHSKELFKYIASLKFGAFSLLAEYLVGIFAKCGDVEASLEAFHILPYRSAFSWTALIFMYLDCGEPKVALQLYQLMQEENVDPSERTFVALLQACGCTFDLKKGREIHKVVDRAGMATNAFVVCTLVSMYGKCGSIAEAMATFCEMPNHSVVSWTALLAAFLEQEKGKETLQLYKLMLENRVSPNNRTIVVALQACGELGRREGLLSEEVLRCMKGEALEIGLGLHSFGRRRGFHTDVFVGSTLVSMYGKCGRVLEAENIFVSKMDQCNIVSWNAMLSAYLECGLENRALQLYTCMLKEKLSLNKRTYAIVIQASCMLAEKEESIIINKQLVKTMSSEVVQAIHTDARGKKFDEDIFVGSALVCAYGKCGNVIEAENVFTELRSIDIVAWTGLLFMYVEVGETNKALNVYIHMQEKGMILDDVIFVCALQACAESGNVVICEQIHFALSCTSYSINPPLALNLIHTYGDCTCVESAGAVFNGLDCPNVNSWTALLDGYAREGNYVKSLCLFEELKQAGINPDGVCFLLALSSCGHIGLVEKGLEYFESMYRDYNVLPEVKHYASVVNLLGRVGDFLKLECLLLRMPVEPNMAFWLSLLDACRMYGNVSAAKWAFDQAVRLDPEEASPYAIMLSIYANAGLWDFATDIKNLRRYRGVVYPDDSLA